MILKKKKILGFYLNKVINKLKEALLKGVWKPGSNGSAPRSKSKGKPMHQHKFFFLLG